MAESNQTFRALILDDDGLIRNLMTDALSSDDMVNWVITPVLSAEDAWRRLCSGQQFDVASVDIRLEGPSGLDLIEDMRKNKVPVPVVVVSGTVDTQTVLRCLENGASDYVIKPFEIGSYRGAMRRAAQMYKDGAELWTPLDFSTPMSDWIEITAPSRREFLVRFRQFSKAILRTLRSPRAAEDLRLALEEMVYNAIEWGNQFKQTKSVQVAYCVFSDRIVVKVEDEGEGFVPGDIEDPSKNPLEHSIKRRQAGKRPGGYGIHLVKSIMDEVIYNRKGNVVLFTKYIL